MSGFHGKDKAGNCLILLVFFSMLFMNLIVEGPPSKSVINNSGSSLFSISNNLLLLIPFLIWLSIKTSSKRLKAIYLASVAPIIFSSGIVSSSWTYYANLFVTFIIIGSIMKYVDSAFETYRISYIKNNHEEPSV